MRIERAISIRQPYAEQILRGTKREEYRSRPTRIMKTKWGRCGTLSGRISLNLELAKKPVQCLEYLVVHELAHLLVGHRNDRFTAIMDHHLPPWRLLRDELNAAPLAHETWSY